MMEVWAHRGTNIGAIENTLDAFRAATKFGVHGIELDVRLCGSGEVVVFHDPTLWRLCKKFVVVANTSLQELRREAGFYIPTLDEVVNEFRGHRLIIDLKGSSIRGAGFERAVLKSVSRLDPHQYELSSDSFICLSKLYAMTGPDKPKLTYVMDKRSPRNALASLIYLDCISISDKLVSKRFFKNDIRKLKKSGYKIRVYTVNSAVRAQYLALAGADGIFTDEPQYLGAPSK